jgi:hypothetical protein
MAQSVAGPQGLTGAAEGVYERRPVENDWHRVTLRATEAGGTQLRWSNAAGVSWSVQWTGPSKTPGVYCAVFGTECPYGTEAVEVLTDRGGQGVTGVRWNGEMYTRVGPLKRQPEAVAFLASKGLDKEALSPLGLEALEAFLVTTAHYQVRWPAVATAL